MSTVTIKSYSHEASIFLVIQRSFGKGIINRMLYSTQSTEKLCFHLTLLNWQKKNSSYVDVCTLEVSDHYRNIPEIKRLYNDYATNQNVSHIFS